MREHDDNDSPAIISVKFERHVGYKVDALR